MYSGTGVAVLRSSALMDGSGASPCWRLGEVLRVVFVRPPVQYTGPAPKLYKRSVIPVMVLTTGRVVIALFAFGVLYLLQSRSRKISDDFLRKQDQRGDHKADLELERQRAQEYEQFELKNEIAQRATVSGRFEGESKGDGEDGAETSAEMSDTARSPDGGASSDDDSGRSVDANAAHDKTQ